MIRLMLLPCLGLFVATAVLPGCVSVRRLPVSEYVDKMAAGWIGQMVGVGWGEATEFRYQSAIIPEEEMPAWKPELVNAFGQDDLYVEMTFVRTLAQHGFGVSIRQAGIDFANTRFKLWHANRYGRHNLRKGIAPPDSGHPAFNAHADDIDYQIEADYAGLISPGLPNATIELGETFGRLMNYGDGVYGGRFVGGMYAEAFFEDDPETIVRAGLACVPAGSQFHECIRDVLTWWAAHPDDWEPTWRLVNAKYHENPHYRRGSCSDRTASDFNIDAKINAAYIAMGLLYGQGDPDKTVIVATRCGQDSDCNPSNAAGVLFTTIGRVKLPERFTAALDLEQKFVHTDYSLPELIEVCEALARENVVRNGGRIVVERGGREVFVIPARNPEPGQAVSCWEPEPIADSRFTDEELARITVSGVGDLEDAVARFAPGWSIINCGEDMDPGLRETWGDRSNVLVTHPFDPETGCVLWRDVEVPAAKDVKLRLVVGHDPRGDWRLVVKADESVLLTQIVGEESSSAGWTQVEVDLTHLAGQTVRLQLVNAANGWAWEAGYWAEIAIEARD